MSHGNSSDLKKLVGREVEIAYECSPHLRPYSGMKAKVVGLSGGGSVVLDIGHSLVTASAADLYIERKVVVNFSTPLSIPGTVGSTLGGWDGQREYLLSSCSGLESICFDVSKSFDSVSWGRTDRGFEFFVPGSGEHGGMSLVFPFLVSGKSWYTYPLITRGGTHTSRVGISDHWERVYSMGESLSPFPSWARSFRKRRQTTKSILVPMAEHFMGLIIPAYESIIGSKSEDPAYSIGFSKIRVPPNSIGLNDPPSGGRHYHIVSVSPEAAKDPHYLCQVVLHECIHVVVGKVDGEPHNDIFNQVSEMVGLEPGHRD